MKKSVLVKLAEGHKLIAEALMEQANEAVETPVAKADNTKSSKPTKQEPEVVAEETEEEEGYSLAELQAMKISELKEIATENGIEFGSKIKKDDLIDLIMEAGDEEEEADEESEEEVDEDSEGDEEEELTEEDLAEMSLAELKEVADEYEIEYSKSVKAPKLRAILIEELFAEEEEEEEEEDEEGEELSPEDLEEMSLAELRELADEYGVKYTKATKAPKLRDLLIEELFEDEEEEEDEEDLAEAYGLNEMSVDELAELLTEHELSAKGKKEALIARVLKGIEDGVIELDEEEGE